MSEGVLAVVKPPGMTSHDVVDCVRRAVGVKTGHTGTLDPAAAGLLLLCLGRATRLSRYLTGCDKTYRAEITFGLSTDSGDCEGLVSDRRAPDGLEAGRIAAAQARLVGEVRLPVPRLSAVKQGGRPLHRRTRCGEHTAPPERDMRVDRWELLDFSPGPPPVALSQLTCAAGTYIRSLVTALARSLDAEAYLSLLVRTRIGNLDLAQALTLEEIEQAPGPDLAARVISPAEALSHLPAMHLSSAQATLLSHGRAVPLGATPSELAPEASLRALDPDGDLLAVARLVPGEEGVELRAETVLKPAVAT